MASAAILLSSVACALAAASIERPWTQTALKAGVNGVAFSLLAGWLCVASALAIGIGYLAATGEPESCERRKYGPDGRRIRESYSIFSNDRYGDVTYVPLLLAVAVGAAAGLLPDPLLPLGIVWAVTNLRYTHSNLAGLFAAFAGFVVAVVRLGVRTDPLV